MSIIKFTTIFVTAAILLTTATAGETQQGKEPIPAPLPSQIYTGKKVFISNAGGDSKGLYTGDASRLYNQFYAAIKNWGRDEIVSSPAEADLVLEVSLANPFVGEYVSGGGQASVSSRSMSDLNSAWWFWIPEPASPFGFSPSTLSRLYYRAIAIRISIKRSGSCSTTSGTSPANRPAPANNKK